MKAQINIEKFALELLDFTGGEVPTEFDYNEWRRWRGYEFTIQEKHLILQTSESLLTNP